VKSVQRVSKLHHRTGVRQYATYVSGRAALGLHAVNQHGPAIPAQLLDDADRVAQHEVKMVIDARLVDEAHINF
jgi:hypothetical protein